VALSPLIVNFPGHTGIGWRRRNTPAINRLPTAACCSSSQTIRNQSAAAGPTGLTLERWRPDSFVQDREESGHDLDRLQGCAKRIGRMAKRQFERIAADPGRNAQRAGRFDGSSDPRSLQCPSRYRWSGQCDVVGATQFECSDPGSSANHRTTVDVGMASYCHRLPASIRPYSFIDRLGRCLFDPGDYQRAEHGFAPGNRRWPFLSIERAITLNFTSSFKERQ